MKPLLYQRHYFENLKSLVLAAAGIEAIVPADCYGLSLKIADKTGKQVSETTLKRVFGFTSASYRPSRYTLNVLSEYAGFADWEAACHHTDLNITCAGALPTWAEVRTAATRISLHTVQGNRYQCGIPYELAIPRRQLEEYLNEFVASDRAACVVDGDTGAGKTVAITQWVEKRINESTADIVLFTNSHTIRQHLLMGYDGNRWLAHVLGLVSPDLVNRFMADHAHAAPANFFLVVDETRLHFDREQPDPAVFAEMASMVSYFSQYPWFRFVMAMRSTTFDLHRGHYANMIAKPQWFIAEQTHRSRAVQPFTDQELGEVLGRLRDGAQKEPSILPAELDGLRMPQLFQYYYEMAGERTDPITAGHSMLFRVYQRYISRIVGSISLGADTRLFLDALARLARPTPHGYHIPKKDAIELIQNNKATYRALLNTGFIKEISSDPDLVEHFYIGFQSDMVLSYFLAQNQLENSEPESADAVSVHDETIRGLVSHWQALIHASGRRGDTPTS